MFPTQPCSSRSTLAGALVLLAILALLAGCQLLNEEETVSPLPGVKITPGSAGAWYSIYFSDPSGPAAERLRGGPDAALADAIDAARLSVDAAVHQMNLWSLRDALLAAHARGVAVRIVTESDYLDEEEVQELKEAGIPVLGDRQEGLMHNKFAVIDRAEVWSGSMNWTINDAYRNNNNLIRIRSRRLAQDYTQEFEEMFVDDLFGPVVRAATPYPSLTIDGVRLEVFFSPDDGTESHLVRLLQDARESIYFMAFSFTSDDLSEAIRERAAAGVKIAGIMDAGQVNSNQGGEYDFFRIAGLEVYLDDSPRSMHHKVMLIDGKIVVTGSYNFSRNAEKVNDENTLIIYSPEIAAIYLEEFTRLLEEARR